MVVEGNNFSATHHNACEETEEEHERTRKLTDYEKYTKTDKFVEEIAKEKLGLLYENEILFRSDINE